jgi:phage-related protein
MSSINNACDFIYGNISSQELGLKLASSVGSTNRSANIETREIVTSSTASSKRFDFHGVKYTSPNTFDLIIYNEDGSYINEYQERKLKKIFMSSKMQWLSINQPSLNNTAYYCIGTKAEIIDIGTFSGAMLLSFQMDSTGAWTNINTKNYVTSNGTLSFKLNIDTDYDDELILPILTITTTSTGDISIKNVTRDKTVTITNCENGELIILDSSSGKISTTSSQLLSTRWNKRYLKLQDGQNEILLSGNFTMKLQYRQQVRIGG